MDTTKYMIHTSKKNKYLPFKEAKQFAISLKLKNIKEWKQFCKSGNKPRNIPRNSDRIYQEQGWAGWKDFLGNSFVPLEEAKQFARNLNIKTFDEWRTYVLNNPVPEHIPKTPDKVYKNKGWINWGDFFGTGNKSFNKNTFRSFDEASKFAQNLKILSYEEWERFCRSGKRPSDIPAHPNRHYKEWTHWRNFLGTENIYKDNYLSFIKARIFVRKLKLKNYADWRAYVRSGKRPDYIPTAPDYKYKNKGWINWGDFLGTFTIGNRYIEFLPFPQARKFVRRLKLKKYDEWVLYAHSGKKPFNIPFTPEVTYKNKGWKGYIDFLGIKK